LTARDEVKSVLIVGAGFGGVGMAIRLKQAGVTDFMVGERAAGPGGVWWANRYPGAACDVESHLYSFSFATNFDWSSAHGKRDEILSYFNHCIDRFGIAPHLRFNDGVKQVRYEAEGDLWRVELQSGMVLRARALISACGLFNTPMKPDFKGMETFRGPRFHSAEWDPSFNPEGLRISVLGTGCSAAQFVPEIVEAAKSVTVFQRTPAFVGPRPEKRFSPARRALYRALPFLRKLDRLRVYLNYEKNFQVQIDPVERETRVATARAFVAREVTDPAKREKLMPATQAGCKRNVRSGLFLKALDRPDVEIVTQPIDRFTPEGVLTRDGALHELDAVIYGTGFAAAQYLSTFDVIGPEGTNLRETWGDAAEAYLGVTVAGYPNFFMIYGPNTNAQSSIIFIIECQINYILKCIRMLQRGRRRLEVKASVQQAYNAMLQTRLAGTSWASGCASYFMNKAGRIVTQFPDTTRRYKALTRSPQISDFRPD
jgi:cation diffusion facilitator CzcD-associated flavoprotein CzcO